MPVAPCVNLWHFIDLRSRARCRPKNPGWRHRRTFRYNQPSTEGRSCPLLSLFSCWPRCRSPNRPTPRRQANRRRPGRTGESSLPSTQRRTSPGAEPPARHIQPDDARLCDVCFVDPQHGWAVGDHGVILHTDDGGQHWSPQASGVTCTLTSVCFVDARNGWAAGGMAYPYLHDSSGVVLSTRDGGLILAARTGAAAGPAKDPLLDRAARLGHRLPFGHVSRRSLHSPAMPAEAGSRLAAAVHRDYRPAISSTAAMRSWAGRWA